MTLYKKLAIAMTAIAVLSPQVFSGNIPTPTTQTAHNPWQPIAPQPRRIGYQENLDNIRTAQAYEDINRNSGIKPSDGGIYGKEDTVTTYSGISPPSEKEIQNNYYKTYHQEPIWSAWTRGGGWYNYTHKKIKKNRFSVDVNGFGRVASWKQWTGCSRCSSNLKNRVWSVNGGKSQVVAYPLCHQPYVSDGCKHDGNLFIRSVIN